MTFIAPLDAMFLASETREHPMHVGGLHVFRLPPDAPADYVHTLYRQLLDCTELAPMYRRKPAWPGPLLGALRWVDDDDVDLEYHVRLSALPRPGRVRELLALVSRLHGGLLDRHRPLWEFHLIEGLEDNRFAVYAKIHHALTDGVNAVRNTMRMLSVEPAGEVRALWSPSPRPALPLDAPAAASADTLVRAGALAKNIAGLVPTLAGVAVKGVRDPDAVLPFDAPKTVLNRPLTGARRFAAQSWSIDRIKAVAKEYDATLNDVVLAMCSGALREYLRSSDQLPAKSLVAAVPVALPRTDGDGNAVTMVLSRLATDVADPIERLRRIQASMRAAKDTMGGRTPLQLSAIGALTSIGPSSLATVPGFSAAAPPPYNVVISNVPGPRDRLYWRDAELEGWYPVSMPIEGQSLNITVLSYGDNLEFGLTGCRRNVAHLQRLLGHLEDTLATLEAGAARPSAARTMRPATTSMRSSGTKRSRVIPASTEAS
ncbi:wax ester/triacylglycerol synthase family O-acyltransferase [Mycolicibacterium sp. GF69]|uniref:WS/DGAT/MGAT family O-acyltransferase n=1 Tax=Mycolicibacterium sp. GF69 TaxID=2267251 RepID=UPI000DCD9635|nr:wax ester/triacylglycerol synthase family O-acyltransferase [Mycolicibacterium sp. GF69]RAV08938.1 wax ester/triacylglycerol synthase family O-acyltransferase [Mycolicibacterium sp. GF69]